MASVANIHLQKACELAGTITAEARPVLLQVVPAQVLLDSQSQVLLEVFDSRLSRGVLGILHLWYQLKTKVVFMVGEILRRGSGLLPVPTKNSGRHMGETLLRCHSALMRGREETICIDTWERRARAYCQVGPEYFTLYVIGGGRASRLNRWESGIRMPTEKDDAEDVDGEVGTRWAVLVAGSSGYGNYRHQADICHAYQLLKKDGLKEENIVVFMYDDIANNEWNPRPGIIINHPQGSDVYAGVPKDYTGEQVTAENLYAVLLGNKNGVKGGSGKVVDSKPNDRIFVYYSDHGGPGVLGMPNLPYVYAMDFLEVLKKKHASGTYKKMVIYVEACESGSIFEGIMPQDLNIYVTTASNAQESSFGIYCPGMEPSLPPEYITCLGDLYSVAWMEDSETHNLKKETVEQQYQTVKNRTSNFLNYNIGSHVMEYGNKNIKAEKVYLYQGFDPATVNLPPNNRLLDTHMEVINQRDAELFFLWQMYKKLENGSQKDEILKQITETMRHRTHLDGSIELIGTFLYGPHKGSSIFNSVREPGMPLVDDWGCLKSMVRLFESYCGSLTQYGMKHMRAFANICNSGVSKVSVEEAFVAACSGHDPGLLHPSNQGYSA